jgi:hypothetical protein
LSTSAEQLTAGSSGRGWSQLIGRLMSGVRRRLRRYPAEPRVQLLRDAIDAPAVRRDDGPLIAVQCLEDPLYFGLFAAVAARMREASGARIELVVVRSISSAIGSGWMQSIARSSWLGWLVSNQWIRAYRGLADGVAYRSQSLLHPFADAVDWVRSWVTWLRERDNPAWAALRIDGVPVGDLIIDSYLRFCPSPHFDSRSRLTRRILWQAYRDVRMARKYFARRRPHMYLTSYSTYVEHGIPARVALLSGIRVFSFGNLTRFGKELTVQDWFHTADTSEYRAAFAALDDRPRRLAEAEQQLRLRLGGAIDAATSYMKVSAYSGGAAAVPDLRDAVVVFLHDFYDSPHVYDQLVFDDFWSWACFTIDTLQAAGIRFVVKPHPNQVALSGDATRRLLQKYPHLGVLPTNVRNTQLVEAGMKCGVTVYGTVAHELAFLGVPTIACARHPHHAFEFCRTARSVEQYGQYLREAGQQQLGPDEMREQALAFYYMHNLHLDTDAAWLRTRFIALWKACHDEGWQSAVLLREFNELRTSPVFQAFVDRLGAPGAARR